jgi:glycosyltransferase involved in cell wall biosynthesis
MKILFHCPVPFMLAHGGQQIQILRTREALEKLGIEVEFLRWHDAEQPGDVLQVFGRIPVHLLAAAQRKGMKVVVADLLAAQGARPAWRRSLQKFIMRGLESVMSADQATALGWRSYGLADACIALTDWEARLLREMFGARPERIHVVPNGVEDVFLNAARAQRGPWLVCVATIAQVKRVVELAQAAIEAQTPIWFIGQPYSESDSYVQSFVQLARSNPNIIRYEGPIQDRTKLAQAYREARGFVLLSAWESLSLSALEASACECPLLLSDLPWARSAFSQGTWYCPVTNSAPTAEHLRKFYNAAPTLKPPPKPLTWLEVGQQLLRVYKSFS